MSGFIGSDGSALAGALNTSSIVQGLKVDALGGLLVNLNNLGPISNAQAYFATTGQESLSNATNDTPTSLFNPAASGKSLLITSWIVSSGTGALIGFMYLVTTDPAYASNLLISNAKARGAASVASGTFVNTNQAVPGTGTQFRRIYNNNMQEMIPNGFGILLPQSASQGNGVVTMMETYANGIAGQSLAWLEF